MSAKNIRLWNKQKFDIGVVLSDNPAGVNIGHGKFQMVSEDDLYFISATCDCLQRGLLEVEENKAQVLEDAGKAGDVEKLKGGIGDFLRRIRFLGDLLLITQDSDPLFS